MGSVHIVASLRSDVADRLWMTVVQQWGCGGSRENSSAAAVGFVNWWQIVVFSSLVCGALYAVNKPLYYRATWAMSQGTPSSGPKGGERRNVRTLSLVRTCAFDRRLVRLESSGGNVRLKTLLERLRRRRGGRGRWPLGAWGWRVDGVVRRESGGGGGGEGGGRGGRGGGDTICLVLGLFVVVVWRRRRRKRKRRRAAICLVLGLFAAI
ncbi:hypothetical protein ACLB2K_027462 [Fragaria x ananassa]